MWSYLEQHLTTGLVLIILVAFYFYLKYHYNYWTRHNVLQLHPLPFVGNLLPILSLNESAAKVIQRACQHPKARDEPILGIYLFHQPALLIKDPELIKRVLVRDFAKFCDRFANSDVANDPLGSQNLFLLKNPTWKEIRFKLTPFFTRCKIKKMFPLIEEVGQNLNTYLLQNSSTADNNNNNNNLIELEVKEISALYTTDVIATCAFGIQANSFENPNGHFRRNGRAIFHFNLKRCIYFTTVFFLPRLVSYLRAKVVEEEQTDFLRSTINYVIAEREKSGKVRNDLIDILIEFKNNSKLTDLKNEKKIKFEGDLLVAQAAIFFTAGFESSSATMAFTLYELARNPDVQKKLRQEVYELLKSNNNDGKLSLDDVDSLEYMQMVISETLRLYPPLPFLDRECTVEKGRGYSLQPFHPFAVPRGMPVYIPVYGLHTNPKYFPDPYTFMPERFSVENRKNITPYTYMPFGQGPHACIGERFAYLQTKVGLVQFLRNHCVSMSSKTLQKIKFEPKALIIQSAGGIILNVRRDPLIE